jgi:hypothetical protein
MLIAAVVFAIYIDSYTFVFSTAVLQLAFGVNSSIGFCEGAIILCLVCYVSTKVSPSELFLPTALVKLTLDNQVVSSLKAA